MVELMMRRRALLAAGGGIPPEPESWATIATITSSTSWLAPEDGWYRFHVIGKGGNGAGGGATTGSGSRAQSGGGGGGGGGGYAISAYYLKAGDSISCTVSTSYSSCLINGEETRANCGGDGSYGTSTSGGSAGGGGNAIGGNRANYTGNSGSPGGYANTHQYIGTINGISKYSSYYGTGGNGATEWNNFSASYGNGRNGGDGGYYYKEISDGREAMNYTYQKPGVSGSGQSGAIIIEGAA